jgi:anti-anti-sigma factor
MEMTLRRVAIAQKQVLMVSGDIELGSLPRFNDALSRLVTDDAGHVVVVDIDGTGVIEDAALGLILGAAGRARAAGGDIEIVCTDARLRQRFAENGFDRAVTINQSIH